MANLKTTTHQKILWIDLEMTGLSPAQDRILEVAAIVTDWNFTEIATFESGVGHNVADIKALMDKSPFYDAFPANKAALLALVGDSPPEADVQNTLVKFVNQHFAADEPVLLAGNSIHMDRQFIRQWWPLLEARLHYRMLDVSAWKVVVQGKYGQSYTKSEQHRALGDIRESIAELQFYLNLTKLG